MNHRQPYHFPKLRKRLSVWLMLAVFVAALTPLQAEEKDNSKQSKEDLTTMMTLARSAGGKWW